MCLNNSTLTLIRKCWIYLYFIIYFPLDPGLLSLGGPPVLSGRDRTGLIGPCMDLWFPERTCGSLNGLIVP